jgi:hypothetical protein
MMEDDVWNCASVKMESWMMMSERGPGHSASIKWID